MQTLADVRSSSSVPPPSTEAQPVRSLTGYFCSQSGLPGRAGTVQRMTERVSQARKEHLNFADFPSLGIGVGWTTSSASTPVWNANRTVGLVFLGEHFSESPSVMTSERSADSLAVLDLYEKHGSNFVSFLNGTFSGVLLDLRQDKALLFNDRFGLGRIYVHEARDGLYFASEAKALLTVLPSSREIDQRGLAEFFSLGCVLQNRTLFRGVSLLPPGSLWTLGRHGTIERGRYFDPGPWEHLKPLRLDEYSDRLTCLCRRLMPRYLKHTGAAAMSMTGGLDSRLILAWAQTAPGSLPCYTFGGPYRDCADVKIARKLAAIAHQPHTTLRIGADFFSDFASLAEQTVVLSDGTMDVSGAVELYMNRLAKEISPVRLTGNYGSEILRANIAFRPTALDPALFTPEFNRLLELASETYRSEAKGHRLSFIAFKQVPWHHYARRSIETSVLTPRSPYLDNELVALAYQCPPQFRFSANPVLQSVIGGNPAIDAIGTDRALRQRSVPVFGNMAHRWQEFTAKAEYAYDYGMPPWLARADRMLRPLHLEKLFLGRHKFYHFRIWYRDQLRPALQELGAGGAAQPSCYADGIARKLTLEHAAGQANHTLALHKLLTVQLTERLLTTPPCHN